MTVKEAIEMLSKFPPDAILMREGDEGDVDVALRFELEEMVSVPSFDNPQVTWYYYKTDWGLRNRDAGEMTHFQGVVLT